MKPSQSWCRFRCNVAVPKGLPGGDGRLLHSHAANFSENKKKDLPNAFRIYCAAMTFEDLAKGRLHHGKTKVEQ
jgi:hypothetical protein